MLNNPREEVLTRRDFLPLLVSLHLRRRLSPFLPDTGSRVARERIWS